MSHIGRRRFRQEANLVFLNLIAIAYMPCVLSLDGKREEERMGCNDIDPFVALTFVRLP